jgi:Bacterial pre-peptidase C-terminal domain/Bacterial Ig-like domain
MNAKLDAPVVAKSFVRPYFLLRIGKLAKMRWWFMSVAIAQLSILIPQLSAATFTTNAPITEEDASYDGQDIVVSGAMLTMDGTHGFNSLILTNGAVLTHSPCTATETHKLEVEVSGTISVSADSRIDVTGKGYRAGYTAGNTPTGGATGRGGGSYGGLGGIWDTGRANAVYGDYADPNDWGSGGGDGTGGGQVLLKAMVLHLNGQLLATGGPGNQGAGSGGAIRVEVGTLHGDGMIQANGQTGGWASGGGGRIAVHAQDMSGFQVANIRAWGGGGGGSGGAGTVYLRDTDEPSGTLLIDGSGGGRGWTPLGISGTNYYSIADQVVIKSANSQVRSEHDGLVINLASTLMLDGGTLAIERLVSPQATLINGAWLTSPSPTADKVYMLVLEVSGTINVSANSRIDVSDKGFLAKRTTGNTTNGAATGQSGGSYGGLGGDYNGVANRVYGDYADPEDWGSGAGGDNPGGGLVRIKAGTLQLDGLINASGRGCIHTGGGAGGGVFVAVRKLFGTGSIIATGGNTCATAGGSGGGGRIAVYAEDMTGFDTKRISANGGADGRVGASGSIFLLEGSPHTHARFTEPGRTILFPSQNYTDYINTLLPNGLAIQFNNPIRTESFAPDKLLIEGPLGVIVPAGVAEVGDRLYRFSFAPQTENGAYHFTLSQALLDHEGYELDQNANGIPGETEDAFSFTLILDTVAPRITQHAPAGDLAGTVETIDLFFNEAIDKTTFSTSDLMLRNPTNGIVAISSPTGVGFNRYRVTFPPQTEIGQYHLLVGTSITDLAGNPLVETMADGVVYDASFSIVPVDLEVADVMLRTNQFWAGDPVSVEWQGRNNSGAPLVGDWIDAVYLSPDPFWNITDMLLGTVQHSGGLASNEVYSASLDFNVPGALPGDYYVLVRTDLGNQTRETVEDNNIVSFGPIPVDVRQLESGGSFTDTLSTGNRLQYFAITVPGGESLRLTLDGQSGVNHLFVSHASVPSRLNADINGRSASSDQTIALTGVPGGGTYYVLVSGEQIGISGSYTLSVESAAFFLTAFTPDTLVGGSSERFWVQTLQSNLPAATLTGVGFEQSTTVEFVASDGSVYQPVQQEFASPSMLRLRLPVEKWPAGSYDVRVTKGTATKELTEALAVTSGGEAKLEARIIGAALGPGGGQTLYVEYANVGTRPMPAPLLKVTAYTNAVITVYRLNHRPQDRLNRPTGPSSGGGGGGGGASSIPFWRFRVSQPLNTAQFVAAGSAANPGVLQPGEKGLLPVYFKGLLQDRGEGHVQFSVGSLTADDTTIVNCGSPAAGVPEEYLFPRTGLRRTGSPLSVTNLCPEYLFSPEWQSLESSSQPETADPDGWRPVWANVMNSAGPLWADYVLMLGDNMRRVFEPMTSEGL